MKEKYVSNYLFDTFSVTAVGKARTLLEVSMEFLVGRKILMPCPPEYCTQ
jgi:hypothetical protein